MAQFLTYYFRWLSIIRGAANGGCASQLARLTLERVKPLSFQSSILRRAPSKKVYVASSRVGLTARQFVKFYAERCGWVGDRQGTG